MSSSHQTLDQAFTIRQLSIADYYTNYFDLLGQLTIAPKPTFSNFKKLLDKVNANPNHKIFVIELDSDSDHFVETGKDIIVAVGTILIEPKFIRGLRAVAHIEDIVIDKEYRKMGLGHLLLKHLIKIAMKKKCYKVILNCSFGVKPFYTKLGFRDNNIEMSLYLD